MKQKRLFITLADSPPSAEDKTALGGLSEIAELQKSYFDLQMQIEWMGNHSRVDQNKDDELERRNEALAASVKKFAGSQSADPELMQDLFVYNIVKSNPFTVYSADFTDDDQLKQVALEKVYYKQPEIMPTGLKTDVLIKKMGDLNLVSGFKLEGDTPVIVEISTHHPSNGVLLRKERVNDMDIEIMGVHPNHLASFLCNQLGNKRSEIDYGAFRNGHSMV